MVNRFTGLDGKRLLVEALRRQAIIQGDLDLARKISEAVEVMRCNSGHRLITQDGSDNDLYFVLSGRFSIQVNDREVAVRVAEKHVGEMALVDPKAKRSASVVAIEDSVVAKISEAKFGELANQYVSLWKNIAQEMGDRLRQRNDLVRRRNKVTKLFIASSTEALPVASEIQAGLSKDPVAVTLWSEGVFGASDFSLEALERAAEEADFAVLVFSADDKLLSRGQELDAPRDNVVFELGLFIAAIGRKRTFIVLPQNTKIKIPTDLLGITPITYAVGDPENPSSQIGPVCTELRRILNQRGPK
jgi:CRP/FNR family transcriptional regulator, cyclic AMP receptor protein